MNETRIELTEKCLGLRKTGKVFLFRIDGKSLSECCRNFYDPFRCQDRGRDAAPPRHAACINPHERGTPVTYAYPLKVWNPLVPFKFVNSSKSFEKLGLEGVHVCCTQSVTHVHLKYKTRVHPPKTVCVRNIQEEAHFWPFGGSLLLLYSSPS